MDKNKLLLIAVVALLAGGLVFLTAVFSRTTVVEKVVEKLGAVSNIRNVGNEFGINGLNTMVVSGSFKDATTTIVSVLNPFPATATVSFIVLENAHGQVATSSYYIGCGTGAEASAPRTTSATANEWKLTADVATSAPFFYEASTPTSTVQLGINQYVRCSAHGISTADPLFGDNTWDSAFSNPNNTFDGTFKLEIKR